MTTKNHYRLDPFFQHLLGVHPDPAKLKVTIKRDSEVHNPIIVWTEENILIDGHHRDQFHAELTAEGVVLPPLTVKYLSFATREEAAEYVFTRCETDRIMTPAIRAFRWITANSANLAEMKVQARKNQAQGLAVEGSELAPKVKVNRRKDAAKMAGTNEKDMGAAMKLLDTLADPALSPKERKDFDDLKSEWEAGLVQYRSVESEIAKLAARRLLNTQRRNVLTQALPPVVEGKMVDQIICGDNLDCLEKLDDNSVSLFLTSPPYPIQGYLYAGHNSYDGEYQEYLDGLRARFAIAYRKCKVGGRFIVQIDACWAPHAPSGKNVSLPIYTDIVRLMKEVGFEFFDEICWFKQKTAGGNGKMLWGSYASPSCPKVRRAHEYLLVFFKETPVHEGHKKDNTITTQEFKTFTVSQWYIPPESKDFTAKDGTEHPCPFPETLVYRCVQLYTFKGDLVVDPWNGAGTTTFVAHVLGRRYLGFDFVQQFVDIAKNRIEEVAHLAPEQRIGKLRLYKSPDNERTDGHGKRNPSTKTEKGCYSRKKRFHSTATNRKLGRMK